MEIFEDFDSFFAWYIAIVKSYAPNCETQDYKTTQDAIPKLTVKETNALIAAIKVIQPLPKGVELIINDDAHTAFSTYHIDRVLIAVPTLVRYWLRWPQIIKMLVLHECGHISNGDIHVAISPSHKDCANICMDIRINQNLSTETLNQINCCLFTFKNEATEVLNPETYFPKLGIPLALKNKMTWLSIHLQFHEMWGHASQSVLKPGDYVISMKQINEHAAGAFGVVTAFDKSLDTYTVSKFKSEIQSAWRSENYILLKQLFNDLAGISDYANGSLIIESKKLPELTDGELGNNLINKVDIIKAIPPKESDSKPKVGDFIVTIAEINSPTGIIKIGTYGQIVKELAYTDEEIPKPVFQIKPLTDEAALAFRKDDVATFRELLVNTEGGITKDEPFSGIFPSEFAVTQCPSDNQDSETNYEEADMSTPPAVGDVVKVKANGSWAVVQKINEDFTFDVQDVTEEVAKRILKAK